jgi:hypothetical protein
MMRLNTVAAVCATHPQAEGAPRAAGATQAGSR